MASLTLKSINNTLRGWTLVAIIFFIALFSLGAVIYRDYGLSVDDPIQRYFGKVNYLYIVKGDQSLMNIGGGRYYGPIFEILLYSVTTSPDVDQMYYTRHLFTYFTFVTGVFVFYLLIRKILKKDWLALAGGLALVLSPRIFADAFYNTKDIPFMVAFIFAMYTLIRYLDQPSIKNILLHALTCAFLIDIRIPGLAIVVITIGFLVMDLLFNRRKSSQLMILGVSQILIYIVACTGLVIIFWPNLWHDPIGQFMAAFKEMSHYPLDATVLFKGTYVSTFNLPITYIPTWITISTPLVFMAGFGAGLVSSAGEIFFLPGRVFDREKRNMLIILVWFFLPLFMVIILKSTLYNAWRQMFFIYPALILIALQGLRGLIKVINRLPQARIGHFFLAGVIMIGMIDPVSFMIRNHPNQNVYFNRLAGTNLVQAKSLYEMDYWGVSCNAALVFILKSDLDAHIYVYSDNNSVNNNSLLLPGAQHERLIFTKDINQAKYFVGGYQYHPQDYPYPNEVFNVSVDGAKLTSVFKLR